MIEKVALIWELLGGILYLVTAKLLIDAIISGANNLKNNESIVNELNIFPVPDGDTGTNMSMTIGTACDELKKISDSKLTVSSVFEIVASSMLRGARGNSGVILSILFRGFSENIKNEEEINGKQLVEAFRKGVDGAYKAVVNPTEGTILTVARVAYEKGINAAFFDNNEINVLEAMLSGANDALIRSPELLPVLKRAKVVDAGGKGLCLIFEGMLSVFKDGLVITEKTISDSTIKPEISSYNSIFDDPEISKFSHQNIKFMYCTEFIVKKNQKESFVDSLRSYFSEIGDSIVVVEDSSIVKVHLHTNNPDLALSKGLGIGDFLKVKIDNMREQNRLAIEDTRYKNLKSRNDVLAENSKSLNHIKLEKVAPSQDFGIVSVALGDGIESLLKELGCTHVVKGGQTMNPSTDDLIMAVRATPAKDVFILPNNKNIFLAAEQVVNVVNDRKVHVVPTKTIPQGIAALLAFSSDRSPSENFASMVSSTEKVKTGQVTFASRNAEFGGFRIKKDDILALVDGKLFYKTKDVNKAVLKLLHHMLGKNNEFITLIYGESVQDNEAEELLNLVQNKFGSKREISLIKGNQPIYHYIISVE